jgi:hypothetical protein
MSNIDYKKLVEYGTKAPSGHNSQPWKFKITEGAIQIYSDRSRSLPAVDPNERELFIGLGCATENIVLAAKAQGLDSKVEMSPDSSCITIRFMEGATTVARWLALINERQSNRSVYSSDPLTETELKALRSVEPEAGVSATIVTDIPQKDRLVELVREGNNVQMQDPVFKKELLSWIRFNKREVQAKGDGLAYDVMGNPALPFRTLGKIIAGSFMKPDKQNQHDDKLLQNVPDLMVFAVKNNDKANWICAGRYFERVALVATELGVAHSHFNQPFETPSLQEKIKELDFLKGRNPCLMIRLGHAEPMPRSPRRKVEEVIL